MMSTITAILEADDDGTLHLPVPAELRHGKIAVTATLTPAIAQTTLIPKVSAGVLERRKEAFQKLRALGGLREIIPDPVAWQRELRQDRHLPGRD